MSNGSPDFAMGVLTAKVDTCVVALIALRKEVIDLRRDSIDMKVWRAKVITVSVLASLAASMAVRYFG